MESLVAHVGVGLTVCGDCATRRSVIWSDVTRRVRAVEPSQQAATQTGFRGLANAVNGTCHEAFLEALS